MCRCPRALFLSPQGLRARPALATQVRAHHHLPLLIHGARGSRPPTPTRRALEASPCPTQALIHGNPAPFALRYSLGNLLAICSTAFLMGPQVPLAPRRLPPAPTHPQLPTTAPSLLLSAAGADQVDARAAALLRHHRLPRCALQSRRAARAASRRRRTAHASLTPLRHLPPRIRRHRRDSRLGPRVAHALEAAATGGAAGTLGCAEAECG